MNYEQKYKEALAQSQEIIKYYKEHNRGDEAAIEDLKAIFPELAESEDEKVRKAILDYLTIMWGNSQDDVCGVHVEDAIAWLEKQGEQNTKHKTVFVKFICKKDWHGIGDYCYGKVYNGYPCEKEQKGYDVYDDNNIPTFCDEDFINEYFRIITEEKQDEQEKDILEDAILDGNEDGLIAETIKYKNEKQGERKPPVVDFKAKDWYVSKVDGKIRNIYHSVDKVEPKFKVGDWLVENEPNNYARFVQILEVVDVQGKERYRISRDIHNDEDIVEFDFVEKYYHKFDIQDAKDGDVLYSPCCKLLWIYKDENTCYVGSNLNYNSCSIVINKPICIPSDVCPATKEQRELLFQKMKEAGYEWNEKEKRLIEVPKTKEETGVLKQLIDEEKSDCSEEDESRITTICTYLQDYARLSGSESRTIRINEYCDWLKSLRPQNRWKPSDEQMETLSSTMGDSTSTHYSATLHSLYNDLKKLKG